MTIIFTTTRSKKENPERDTITKPQQWSVGKITRQNVPTNQTRKHSPNNLIYSPETHFYVKETLVLCTNLFPSTALKNCLLYLSVVHTRSQTSHSLKMVCAPKKKRRKEKHFDELDYTVNDFFIGNGITVDTLANETLEPQNNGRQEDFERFVDDACQRQVIGSETDNKIRDVVDRAFIDVETRMHDMT